MSEEDFEPRPNDFLVEPLFAPFEQEDVEPDAGAESGSDAPKPTIWARLVAFLGRG
ncbi:MAG: hypothetical protein P1V81_11430 [Planctomycetota bacterium]|nr:hypothetical protein [Planctomycetota bacterium]